jgi:hypothetical protein
VAVPSSTGTPAARRVAASSVSTAEDRLATTATGFAVLEKAVTARPV